MRSLSPSKSSARPRDPGVPSQKLQPEPVIVDPQISIAIPRDGVRRDALNLLGHDADIGCVVAPLITETVDAEAIIQPSQGNDVFLEPDIGTMAAASATTATAPATTATAPTTTAVTTRLRSVSLTLSKVRPCSRCAVVPRR